MVFFFSRKVFQKPRNLGIGLCFQSEPPIPELAEKVLNICRHLGYTGALEVEFIKEKKTGCFYLSDFNPRFYSQMGFEIERGLKIPQYLYLAAQKKGDEAERVLKQDLAKIQSTRAHYSCKWLFSLVLTCQALSKRMGKEEKKTWTSWLKDPETKYFDFVYDRYDPWPAIFDILYYFKHYLRHPRAFYRNFFL